MTGHAWVHPFPYTEPASATLSFMGVTLQGDLTYPSFPWVRTEWRHTINGQGQIGYQDPESLPGFPPSGIHLSCCQPVTCSLDGRVISKAGPLHSSLRQQCPGKVCWSHVLCNSESHAEESADLNFNLPLCIWSQERPLSFCLTVCCSMLDNHIFFPQSYCHFIINVSGNAFGKGLHPTRSE